jgi:acetylornithine deacetylase
MQAVDPDTGVELEVLTSYPGLSTQVDAAVVSQVQSLLNDSESTQKISFGSEAGLFAGELGIPAVVCGPGSIQQAHRANEYVSEEQLDRCMRFMSKLTDSLVDGIAFS